MTEVIEKWVKALESGDFEQGRGTLRNIDGHYCCLGVLCEIAVAEGVIGQPKLAGRDYTFGTSGESAALPYEVMDWAGLEYADPPLVFTEAAGVERVSSCIAVNDGDAMVFTEIAALIRRNYLETADVSDVSA